MDNDSPTNQLVPLLSWIWNGGMCHEETEAEATLLPCTFDLLVIQDGLTAHKKEAPDTVANRLPCPAYFM